jgi:low temperature requirement protein LtrA
MLSAKARAALFRQRENGEETPVTPIELFFDLVFVFAITQLSHRLLDHLTVHGAIETLILFLAVWWLWMFTSWATNWLDPERGLVRAMLMVMMLGGLVLSSVLPAAFGDMGLVFALTYLVLQIGRTLIVAWAAWGHNPGRARNFLRIAAYFVLSAPFWIAGALADAEARLWWWAGAIAIEYAAPFLMFRVPGLGASRSTDWDISGAHMAERCGLFIIIALGEAILVTGATFADLKPTPATIAAFAVSFIASAAMWWVYFDIGAKRAGETIDEDGADTGRVARNAYTYLHMPIVAGIVVTAVADEMMLAHPTDHADLKFVLVACGGPFLFLLGNQAFKWITARYAMPPLSHFIGQLLLIGVGVAGLHADWSPIVIGAAATGALIVTAVWEWFSLNGGWQRWTPWIGRRAAIALEDSER